MHIFHFQMLKALAFILRDYENIVSFSINFTKIHLEIGTNETMELLFFDSILCNFPRDHIITFLVVKSINHTWTDRYVVVISDPCDQEMLLNVGNVVPFFQVLP